jgi:hypothetical protein
MGLLHLFGDCAMLVFYPVFLAAALQTPLTRVFASRQGQVGLLLVAVSLYSYILLGPDQRIGMTLLFLALVVTFIYALVASTNAWYTSTGIARTRALIFVLAFGFRDLCWGYCYGFASWDMWWGTSPNAGFEPDLSFICYILGTLVAVPLIAYGILRTQLFDIDLRIRWTIRQSTVASVFIAVMFIVSEGASQFLSDELGKVTGLLAAGVLMFFLAPLQRFAERVANSAMPNTKNTAEYAAFRKMQVYETAFAEAFHEEGISDRERALLVRLRDSLGITEADAEAIELELQARQSNLQFAAAKA